jgi:hypothetical protein
LIFRVRRAFDLRMPSSVPAFEREQLLLLYRREGVRLVAGGQVMHPGLILLTELHVEDRAGQLARKPPMLIVKDASQDGHFVVTGADSGCAHGLPLA